jgi:hypothetical protein
VFGTDVHLGRAPQRPGTAHRRRQPAPDTPITGNLNPLLSKGADAQGRKQYLLGGQPLFDPYAGAPRLRGERSVVARGGMYSIEQRGNPQATVYVKRGLQPHPDPAWLRAQGTRLNQIHAALADPDAQPHRGHLAVEVLKEIEDGERAVYLTPIVQGFTVAAYLQDAAGFNGRFPVGQLDAMKRDLGRAMFWLSEKGFVHGDVKPDNLLYDEVNRRLVLIDFELASPVTREGLNRDFIALENVCEDIEWLHGQPIHPVRVML